MFSFSLAEKVQILPNDIRFQYEGRWSLNRTTSHGKAVFADWPCSSINFQVEIDCLQIRNTMKNEDNYSFYVEALMFNLRTRMVANITPLHSGSFHDFLYYVILIYLKGFVKYTSSGDKV